MNARIDLKPRLFSVVLSAAMAVAPFAAALAGAPFVSGGKLGPTVHVPQQVSPTVTLDIHGDAQSVFFYWQPPSGNTWDQTFFTSIPSGKYVFQASQGITSTFGPYTQAGTWTLTFVEVCGYKGCSEYSGSTLAGLFPSLNLLVVNPKSDTTPPTVSGGAILTPTVAISKHSIFEASLTVQDDVSGVTDATITFSNGGSGRDTSFVVGGTLTSPVVTAATVPFLTVCDCKKFAAGTYNAVEIYLRDSAGNYVAVTDPATISSLLGGQTSITLTE